MRRRAELWTPRNNSDRSSATIPKSAGMPKVRMKAGITSGSFPGVLSGHGETAPGGSKNTSGNFPQVLWAPSRPCLDATGGFMSTSTVATSRVGLVTIFHRIMVLATHARRSPLRFPHSQGFRKPRSYWPLSVWQRPWQRPEAV